MMKISQYMMNKAVEAKILTEKQAQNLVDFVKNHPEQGPSFDLANVLYYLGGLLSIGAMTLFMNLGWELFGDWGIVSLCVSYAILGLSLTHSFYNKGYLIPAGISATFVICLTPLAIYGLQQGMGWWPDHTVYQEYHYYVNWHWIFMELGTLAVGVVLAWIYQFPFMIMPIAVTLWYMSMDLTAMLSGGYYSFELSSKVSMYFGLMTVLVAFWVDIRSRHSADYAYWLYIVGIMAFWVGLTSQHSDSEISKFIYFILNLFLIMLGVVLNRKVFVLFGAIGSFLYVGYLAFQVFQNSYLFPITLTVIGLAVIYLGILWQKYELVLTKKLRSYLPKPIQELLQAREHLS